MTRRPKVFFYYDSQDLCATEDIILKAIFGMNRGILNEIKKKNKTRNKKEIKKSERNRRLAELNTFMTLYIPHRSAQTQLFQGDLLRQLPRQLRGKLPRLLKGISPR